jgi:glycosyltransferase involved in cell wall biosynthesis
LIKLLHVITSLGIGGAETMLLNLISALDSTEVVSEVVSLSEGGSMRERLRAAGTPVRELGMVPGRVRPGDVALLTRWTRAARPDLVQTWMYHADLVGGVSARLAGVPVIWGIRQGNLDPALNRWSTLGTATLCASLSKILPARIVICSRSASAAHEEFGYSRDRMVVIPNGFDPRRFRPDPVMRQSMRAELGIPDDTPLVGLAARLDPQKDHATFFRAAERVHAHHPDVRFTLCGDGIDSSNATLMSWVNGAGLGEACHLLGRRDDVPRFFAALDVAVSSSCGEGFPNVVGEAMACGVPCVVTDVGDSAFLVGETGLVVPPREPEALANAISALFRDGAAGRQARGMAARDRIEQEFALPVVAARYRRLYEDVLSDVRADRLR